MWQVNCSVRICLQTLCCHFSHWPCFHSTSHDVPTHLSPPRNTHHGPFFTTVLVVTVAQDTLQLPDWFCLVESLQKHQSMAHFHKQKHMHYFSKSTFNFFMHPLNFLPPSESNVSSYWFFKQFFWLSFTPVVLNDVC